MAKRLSYKPNKALSKANNEFEYCDERGIKKKERFIQLYLSMIESEAYLNLSTTQQQLLTFMCMQTHNQELIKKGYGVNAFYFNKTIKKNFRLTNDTQNIKNIRELAEKGFIEILEDNRFRKKKNIYRLSSDWQRKK